MISTFPLQNNDQQCIKWAILAALYYDVIAQKMKQENKTWKSCRPSYYVPYEHNLNMDGIAYPTPLKQVKPINNHCTHLD